MKINLNKLTQNFAQNMEELKELLKLPQKYEKQAKMAKKELDRFVLPLFIDQLQQELQDKSIKEEKKEDIREALAQTINDYKKIEPNNIKENGELLIKIDEKYVGDFNKIKKQRERLSYAMSHKIHIEKAVLFNLISYLEQSLSDISHIILKQYPEILKLNEKTLKFDEIRKFDGLDDAEEFLISQEIEQLLFKPLSEFFNFFEQKVFKTTLPNLSKFKNELIEIKERRNLLIHNGAIINSKYLNTVDISLQKKFNIKKDNIIPLGRNYLKDSIDKIELIGLELLIFSAVKFQNKDDQTRAMWNANQIIFETFSKKDKNYFLGENLSIFILDKCKKYLTNELNDYITLNYWHIIKKQKRIEEIEEQISKYDASSKNNIIKLCFFALKNDYKEACKYIIPSLNEEKFDLEQYEIFQILEDLRKTKEAKKVIEEYKKDKSKK